MLICTLFGISDFAKLALDFKTDDILLIKFYLETHIQRQAALHDYLLRLLGDGDT
jgi:hypothetical protein